MASEASPFPLSFEPEQGEAARHLAATHGLRPVPATALADEALRLHLGGDGLSLRAPALALRPLVIDFCAPDYVKRRRSTGRRGALGRAVGLRPGYDPSVWDLTAGLGRDASVLAALGCRVLMVERHPALAALLDQALRAARARAGCGPAEDPWGAERLSLAPQEAADLLRGADAPPDVVYLDPMYPLRRKQARVRRELQYLHALLGVGAAPDGPELLAAALERARHRVTVKRPKSAPPLDGPEVDLRVTGETTRYDIYLTGARP
jgi:16S rRNA (guanine1516-N2)-methyltransferase